MPNTKKPKAIDGGNRNILLQGQSRRKKDIVEQVHSGQAQTINSPKQAQRI
jgi:hypothetical protein